MNEPKPRYANRRANHQNWEMSEIWFSPLEAASTSIMKYEIPDADSTPAIGTGVTPRPHAPKMAVYYASGLSS